MDAKTCIQRVSDFIEAATAYHEIARRDSAAGRSGDATCPKQAAARLHAEYKLRELKTCLKYAPPDVCEAVEEIHNNHHGDLAQRMRDACGPLQEWLKTHCKPPKQYSFKCANCGNWFWSKRPSRGNNFCATPCRVEFNRLK